MELSNGNNVISLGRQDADLSDPKACSDIIYQYMPKAVINAAAYTDVEKAEDEKLLATIINGEAPTEMATACAKLNIPFVHISTDYVFDGRAGEPWIPDDPENPINHYGESKLAGELGIRASGVVHAILRTSWVFSAHGSNFVKTMLKLSENRKEINVVADQIGGPTPARSIAIACLFIAEDLIRHPWKSGTYHLSGVPDVSWAEFASEIFSQLERTVAIKSVTSKDYPRQAMRPLNSCLDCSKTEKFFDIKRPFWQFELNTMLRELGVFK